MNIVVTARHMNLSDDVRQRVEDKAEKLSRFLDELQTVEVTLEIEGDKPLVEIVATASRKTTFVATARDDDMVVCFDHCLHKVSEQIRRYKDKVRDRHGLPHSETMDVSEE